MSMTETLAQIEGVDAVARDLYRRAKSAGPEFDDAVTVVRRLHSVLKHLKAEAEDIESTLNSSERSTIYQRKLTRIIEDSEFALQSLQSILNKHDSTPELDDTDRAKLATVVSQLNAEKNSIDVFLDTVQLPDAPPRVVDTSDANLDAIKDKVDAIAARLCQRRDGGGFDDNEDEMWQQFKVELEREGFSTDVLKKNKVRNGWQSCCTGAHYFGRRYFAPIFEKSTPREARMAHPLRSADSWNKKRPSSAQTWPLFPVPSKNGRRGVPRR